MGDMPDKIFARPKPYSSRMVGFWRWDGADEDGRWYLAAAPARDIADRLVGALKKAGDYIGALPGTDDAIKALEEIRSLLAEIDAEREPQ